MATKRLDDLNASTAEWWEVSFLALAKLDSVESCLNSLTCGTIDQRILDGNTFCQARTSLRECGRKIREDIAFNIGATRFRDPYGAATPSLTAQP